MKDTELQRIVLTHFYKQRMHGGDLTPHSDDFSPPIPEAELNRICNQLGEKKSLEWRRQLHNIYGIGRITAKGVAEIEAEPAILPVQNINIHHSSGFQIGNNNTQNIQIQLQQVIDKIDKSDAPKEQKDSAKDLLKKVLAHPLFSSVAQPIVTAILGS